MGNRQAKDALYDALASVAKALGNGRRAELVDVLAQGERSVEELAAEIGQSVANTSQHLQVLLRAGLVRTRRDGARVYYSLATEAVGALWRSMREVAGGHVARIDELAAAYLGDRSQLAEISREELLARMRAGEVVVLDVRPPAEYAAGHLPDAVNVPPDELEARLADLPAGQPVVAYCRGPLCAYADTAVRALTAAGRPALRLVDGLPEWAAAGLPVVGASA
ncbi:metalloregulator ArsR/SmtB family transcription factor [Blastococcus sp. KM273129]|uniref:ArsR/SmtB family transcription factor n=1 Tax=Blastococcus sp. KM273129 TaxID=2570315 RepID=UPI001F006566|nr:metalloregulator ArsR/SmtB family transcription factor [Blastococcus sp. KM273129]MCF6735532.1 metalloregulator ArsR/SmtB family transcription factor [Blastococcus sp. KM273129]